MMTWQSLLNFFSVEEVRDAIFNMEKDKSPGPDRFSMLFYQNCWDPLQEDLLLKVFTELFEMGTINKEVNATL